MPAATPPADPEARVDAPRDFVREKIAADLAAGRHAAVRTRFPPEPNGYLHIGHAKSICLNFQVAEEHGGECNLRFDDTNPTKEEMEFVEAIQADVRWLGFDWGDRLFFASDYFEQLYAWAEKLVEAGHAYVDSVPADQVGELRGPWHEAGRESPYRDRPPAESLDLLRRMRAGDFPDGAHVLRAKIDMTSGNMNLRDPIMYRIRHAHHHRTGDAWRIYPTYDWAHGQSDALEAITHSLCTLEFEDHRPLYDWYLDRISEVDELPGRPEQTEFARLNLGYTVLSKRKLRQLVEEGHVAGWDDPRMPTLSGLRRRGFTPEAIRDLCARVGLTKRESTVDMAVLEHCLREDLNRRALRRMAVLRPLKVVIENYPEDLVEGMEVVNNPEDESAGARSVPFSRELWIEREDFMEDPPKKFFRLAPGREVRLRSAYLITCREAIEDERGEVVELRCTYDPDTRGGNAPDGRKVKATLHWVSAAHAHDAEVRLYDRLFAAPDPTEGDGDWLEHLNPSSLEALAGCKLEPALAGAAPGERVQFERLGYFAVDPDSTAEKPVWNRIVPLRDTWARIQQRS
ncbi:MAG TPA: glutamine--tRNA ligase/YqeY domain fusion protein [Thermoanaerobaculia bacterium]|nr:glutamine--tRNA ligase/YqeY domain fusion protein [Thermoanaerobaculia bacterium]